MKKAKISYGLIFAIVLLGLEAIYWGYMIISRGNQLENYFVNDFNNTAMDFFNMMANMFNGKPYANNANYPAMCFLILRVLYHIVPFVPEGNSGFFLREYMPAQLTYIMFILIIVIGVWEMLKHLSAGMEAEKIVLAISLIFSGPFTFSLERGNFILLSYLGLLCFFVCYDSEKKYIRYLGYVALAFSASIKIYPALFGILILLRKRYKETIIAIILGVVVFLTPFFAFDGIESIKEMLSGIILSSEVQGNIGMAYNFSFFNLAKVISSILQISVNEKSLLLKIIPLIICFLIFILNKEEWKKIFAIALLCIWIPNFSYTYTLIFFTIPLLFYLKEEANTKRKLNWLYYILFLIIMAPVALPSLGSFDIPEAKFPLNGATLVINLAIIFMCLFMILDGILQRCISSIEKRRAKNGDND